MVNLAVWQQLRAEFDAKAVTLVAVSKTKPVSDILALYDAGQRDFGENYVQEFVEKVPQLPGDIRWHFIGHLQSNKVKYIAGFVHLVHAVDDFKLLLEINKQAAKHERVIDVLLQLHIAAEETKFGMDEQELIAAIDNYRAQKSDLQHVRICGLMGMATNTEDEAQVRAEFTKLHSVFSVLGANQFAGDVAFATCSMGMSSDYAMAIDCGSNMVRIGSLLFGAR